MRILLGKSVIATLWLVALAQGLAAQSVDALYTRFQAMSGFEFRGYDFGPGITTTSTTQWRIPVVAVAPVGRSVSVDVTANYSSSTLETTGSTETLTGLSDTQLRVLYTISRDRMVASLSLNLPTGLQDLSPAEFAVAGAIGSNYLSFPVSSADSGFAATGGVAWAQASGDWNLGFSGSFRYQGSYTPLADSSGSIDYQPGAEYRVRGGADRLLGQRTRLLLGLTFSTFSQDEFTGASNGRYAPGHRFIGELGLARQVGTSTVTLVAWDYYRLAGATNDTSDLTTKENIFNAELRWGFPATPRIQIEPLVGFRQYSPADYRGGRLFSGGVGARAVLTDRWTATLSGRLDTGWVYAEGVGRADVTGFGLTALFRYQR